MNGWDSANWKSTDVLSRGIHALVDRLGVAPETLGRLWKDQGPSLIGGWTIRRGFRVGELKVAGQESQPAKALPGSSRIFRRAPGRRCRNESGCSDTRLGGLRLPRVWRSNCPGLAPGTGQGTPGSCRMFQRVRVRRCVTEAGRSPVLPGELVPLVEDWSTPEREPEAARALPNHAASSIESTSGVAEGAPDGSVAARSASLYPCT